MTHRRFDTQTLLHTDAFTHTHFDTQRLSHTDAFTHRSFYTESFTHRHFYTQTLLHTETFTHIRFTDRRFYTNTSTRRDFYTQTLLHTDTFTHRRFYTQTHFTQTLSHAETVTDRHFYTNTSTRRDFYTHTLLQTDAFTQTLPHAEAFTHRRFYTQTLLHTDAFTHRRILHKHFHTQRLLQTDTFTQTPPHAETFTHIRFYRQTLLHKRFHTQRLLHTDTFTHRRVYTQTLLRTQTGPVKSQVYLRFGTNISLLGIQRLTFLPRSMPGAFLSNALPVAVPVSARQLPCKPTWFQLSISEPICWNLCRRRTLNFMILALAWVLLAEESTVLALQLNVAEPKPKFAKDAICLRPGVASKVWQCLSIMPGESQVWPLIYFGLNIPLFHQNLFLKGFPRLIYGFPELTKSIGKEDEPRLKLRRLLDSLSSVRSCSPEVLLGLVFLGHWSIMIFVPCFPNRV